jgi:SCY1-like protein 1
LFKKLLNPSPASRATSKHFLDVGMSESGFFASNKLVKVCLGLDNFAISNDAEKATFLR